MTPSTIKTLVLYGALQFFLGCLLIGGMAHGGINTAYYFNAGFMVVVNFLIVYTVIKDPR